MVMRTTRLFQPVVPNAGIPRWSIPLAFPLPRYPKLGEL